MVENEWGLDLIVEFRSGACQHEAGGNVGEALGEEQFVPVNGCGLRSSACEFPCHAQGVEHKGEAGGAGEIVTGGVGKVVCGWEFEDATGEGVEF